ncbi:ribosome maturation factor RimM [Alteromonas sp. KUL49]|jgi:16S rRNA processing protein RimM|uniref:ribosome maturation factor RimM n=1 Tax=Alteromonas sp. KUL49 TaxID=2480798 RepID=UPI00102F2AEF|nr:ribosome maturation factor RimM [Alteromonas sp. KUL49]TAP41312.1 ribosome maturation factor RimM [Alteromonas sp. KUL49]GEA10375.1 ribosome maturation factor RimM [Alteromonas sp. KUL49]
MSHTSDNVIVGKIGAPYGVKGWVKINSYTEVPEGIFEYVPWFLGSEKEYQIDQWRPHGKSLVAKIEGVDSRDDAERIKNLDISILASQLPELGEEGVYWRELTGMQVVTTQGYNLGVVKDVFNTGANDVIQVKANVGDAFGQKERLLPFVFDDVVQEVDKEAKVIKVDWDPGF